MLPAVKHYWKNLFRHASRIINVQHLLLKIFKKPYGFNDGLNYGEKVLPGSI